MTARASLVIYTPGLAYTLFWIQPLICLSRGVEALRHKLRCLLTDQIGRLPGQRRVEVWGGEVGAPSMAKAIENTVFKHRILLCFDCMERVCISIMVKWFTGQQRRACSAARTHACSFCEARSKCAHARKHTHTHTHTDGCTHRLSLFHPIRP